MHDDFVHKINNINSFTYFIFFLKGLTEDEDATDHVIKSILTMFNSYAYFVFC